MTEENGEKGVFLPRIGPAVAGAFFLIQKNNL